MEPNTHTTRTIAYSLRVVAYAGETGVQTADWLAQRAAVRKVDVTGSHVDGKVGALRFRAPSDAAAIAIATSLIGDRVNARLESGFGVNRRLIAES